MVTYFNGIDAQCATKKLWKGNPIVSF